MFFHGSVALADPGQFNGLQLHLPAFTCLYLLYLPLPAFTWLVPGTQLLHLPLPAFTCLYLPLPAFTCLYLPLPAFTCLVPGRAAILLVGSLPRSPDHKVASKLPNLPNPQNTIQHCQSKGQTQGPTGLNRGQGSVFAALPSA